MQTVSATTVRTFLAALVALLGLLVPKVCANEAPLRPFAWRFVLSGEINADMRERTLRQIKRAVAQGAILLILDLDCGDGDAEEAYDLADRLIRLKTEGDGRIRTIAYVRPSARNTATLLAFACDRIFMDPRAKLGDWEAYVRNHREQEAILPRRLAEVMERKGRSPQPALEMLDYKRPRTFNAEEAVRYGLAEKVDSLDDLYARLELEPAYVVVAKKEFLDDFAALLRADWLRALLVTVGLLGLLLEMRRPGLHLAGVLSAVCFVLFFWAHSQLAGRLTLLALSLFVVGVVLMVVALLVRPNHRVALAGGVVLVVLGLGLAAYGQWPSSVGDWSVAGQTVGKVGMAVLAGLLLCFLAVRYLPQLPGANQLVLQPKTAAAAPSSRPGGEKFDPAELLGAIGVAVTPLRPLGKVQIDGRFLDVVSDGPYVVTGTRVQVIEIEGRRIVVKQV
jgi:membrane-bound serine protease (ClpP class)